MRTGWAAWWGSNNLITLATVFGTDKWGSHWYAEHYRRHFAHLRRKSVTVLEIGIGGDEDPELGGESLRAWKWFFPKGLIAGIDLYPKRRVEEDRIRVFQGSQADPDFLNRVIGEIGRPDIIIDDGSHRSEHVIRSFQVLFPHLKDNGIYAIEDTQTSYWPSWGGREHADRDSVDTSMGFFKALIDGLNHQEFLLPNYTPTYCDRHIVAMHFYHNLIIVDKGLNDEQSNMVTSGTLESS
jgi:hypothetical protein